MFSHPLQSNRKQNPLLLIRYYHKFARSKKETFFSKAKHEFKQFLKAQKTEANISIAYTKYTHIRMQEMGNEYNLYVPLAARP